MDVVAEGRFREARGYLRYLAALLVPGRAVPVFEQPPPVLVDDSLTDDDRKLLIEESHRQLERQATDLGRNHTRAATLLTITIAELAFLTTTAPAVFTRSPIVIGLWVLSAVLAVLALGGTVSVLTSRAVYGRVDPASLGRGPAPILPELARQYVASVGPGEATNAARLTVLRDAVWLAVLAAAALVLITPFSGRSAPKTGTCVVPSGASCVIAPTSPPSASSPSPSPRTTSMSPSPFPTPRPSSVQPTPSTP